MRIAFPEYPGFNRYPILTGHEINRNDQLQNPWIVLLSLSHHPEPKNGKLFKAGGRGLDSGKILLEILQPTRMGGFYNHMNSRIDIIYPPGFLPLAFVEYTAALLKENNEIPAATSRSVSPIARCFQALHRLS